MTESTATTIDPERLNAIMRDCLFLREEIINGQPPSDAIIAEGIVATFGFHPGRLESYRAEVAGMLALLPHEFRKNGGGGWSFLNACNTADGTQWTGFHGDMEALFVLGIGLGIVSYCGTRELWNVISGGMPYVVIDDGRLGS